MRLRRTLPPVAASLGPGSLLRGVAGLAAGRRTLRRREAELRELLGVRHVFLVSSGKAALALILRALKILVPERRKVLIPAYTCYSVPAAILKAGLEISLCDIDPETLDLDLADLQRTADADTLCVLPTHLFGQPAQVAAILPWCRERGIRVVEDSAQAMGGRREGQSLGTAGDAGFYSLGRGKNLTCGAGGIAVTNDEALAELMARHYASLGAPSAAADAADLLRLALMSLFIRPSCYWLPVGLPFLGLGRTVFEPDFPERRLSAAMAGVLHGWQGRLERDNATRSERASFYLRRLPDARGREGGVPYLRLPLLMRDRAERDAACAVLSASGVSTMYPDPIHRIAEIRHLFGGREYPGAERVAARLLSLPTHAFVSPRDRERIATEIARRSPGCEERRSGKPAREIAPLPGRPA